MRSSPDSHPLNNGTVFLSVDNEPRKRSLENGNIIFLKMLELSWNEQETNRNKI